VQLCLMRSPGRPLMANERSPKAMLKFRRTKTLQKFIAVHNQIHNHFNSESHLVRREIDKQRHSAALAKWRAVAA
jgi:putative transposase